jgi:dTDP-4-dehydrorhamnose 3,5-epimerase
MVSISDLPARPEILPAHSHVDDRGTMLQVGELANVPYVNVKMSASRRDVLRGMHYEIEPCLQAKIVRVCAGSIVEAAVDLATGNLYESTLRAESSAAFYVPAGYAHGYRALTDDVVVVYLCTNQYLSACARAFSPLITHFPQFDWGGRSSQVRLSEKDRKAEPFCFPASARHFRYLQDHWAPIGNTAA